MDDFREQVSSVAERQQLGAALDYVREGDSFTVTNLDRLARSVADLLASLGWRPQEVSFRVPVDGCIGHAGRSNEYLDRGQGDDTG